LRKVANRQTDKQTHNDDWIGLAEATYAAFNAPCVGHEERMAVAITWWSMGNSYYRKVFSVLLKSTFTLSVMSDVGLYENAVGKTSPHSKNVEQVTAGGRQLPRRSVRLE